MQVRRADGLERGGEVVGVLVERGWRVRVLSRSADKVRQAEWGDAVVDGVAGPGQVEVVEGDASSPEGDVGDGSAQP